MRALSLWILILLAVPAPWAATVLVQVEGQPPLALEAIAIDGMQHIALEDFIDAVRLADPEASVRWDSARSLRLEMRGVRISLFTDRALVIVESRMHATDGPLLSQGGRILVPASVLRDLFALTPRGPEATVHLPEPPAPEPAPAVIEPILPSLPPEPPPLPPAVQTAVPQALPPVVPPPQWTATPRIALVVIETSADRALVEGTADLIAQHAERGTGLEVVRLTTDGRSWDDVIASVDEIHPLVVLGLQVGESPCPDLEGVGVFFMSPAVDMIGTRRDATSRAMRYRASSQASDLLAQLIEREAVRTGLPWIGRLPTPHRLLRACPAPTVLIELGQASHAGDRERLSGEAGQAQMAAAIAQAIIDFCQITSGPAGRTL
ncbi:N-acetylmuramoyl-L-alanine amidase [Candidatus Sumerlaeota bacterium]|nr:N-acetylmuramoyl-L-alanine amidase [Candidatus Sumerlaeota bacterium]